MAEMSKEKVLKRIAACQALVTDRHSTEAEKERAMTQSLALMAKYNMSSLDVNKYTQARGEKAAIDEESADIGTRRFWARQIVSRVAELYMCKGFYRRGQANMLLVGSELNRQITMDIARQLIQGGVEAAELAYIAKGGGENKRLFKSSFLESYSRAINLRCTKIIEEARVVGFDDPECPGETLPVLASLYDTTNEAVEQFARKKHKIKKETLRKRVIYSKAGIQTGQEHGQKAVIHQEIDK